MVKVSATACTFVLIVHLIGVCSFIFGIYSLLSLRDENTYKQRSGVSLIAKYSFGVSHLLLCPSWVCT